MAPEKVNNFLSCLKMTQFKLDNFVDFNKVIINTEVCKMHLTALNALLDTPDIQHTIDLLWEENPKVFSVLNLLIAVRDSNQKMVLLDDGNCIYLSNFFNTKEDVLHFFQSTGLQDFFEKTNINNLVDYVYGIEVGLDTHARKNRGGIIMQNFIAEILTKNGIPFETQVSVPRISKDLKKVFGKKRKVFDFVVRGRSKTWIFEVNFYGDSGSKINETSSSYINLRNFIQKVPGLEFVWISDGMGWLKEIGTLENIIDNIPYFYNLTSFEENIEQFR